MSDDVARLIGELGPLMVLGAESAGPPLNLSDVSTSEAVRHELEEYFEKNPAVYEVNLVIAGSPAGVVSRKSLDKNAGLKAGGSPAPQVGAGEGMQLPGLSTRYRLLEFTCPHCDSHQYRIHYHERDIPECKRKHGRMELVPR